MNKQIRKTQSFAAIAITLLLTACASGPTKTVAFDASAVAFANQTGNSIVSGQAFYTRDKNGANSVDNTTYSCAGRKVRLIPLSTYTKAETDAWVKKIRWSDPRPIGSAPYNERSAVCDAQGNFTFESLPAGKWIVFASIPFKSANGSSVAGADVNFREFTETDGKNTVRVILAEAAN
ncbi:hypothetical protein [Methylomonas sp. AM2-LC]|uniref:hypothetical protein n=1 Tax=Methylomonas sp. AM2-LC TaxID=3153301 RepID=UPI0032644E5B